MRKGQEAPHMSQKSICSSLGDQGGHYIVKKCPPRADSTWCSKRRWGSRSRGSLPSAGTISQDIEFHITVSGSTKEHVPCCRHLQISGTIAMHERRPLNNTVHFNVLKSPRPQQRGRTQFCNWVLDVSHTQNKHYFLTLRPGLGSLHPYLRGKDEH